MEEWKFRLNDTGMTALHKAGLVGLAASLQVLKEGNALPEGMTFEADDQTLMIRGIEKNRDGLFKILAAVYEIKEGLINFPLLSGWPESRRAVLQRLLLESFWQHPQSREAAKKEVVKQEEIDGNITDYSYKLLTDFNHRSHQTCAKWEDKLKRGEPVELAGWAYPGAMKRHNTVAASVLTDSPEIYPLLLCAPLGCLYFEGRGLTSAGSFDPKTVMFVVIPKYTRLTRQAGKMKRYYEAANSNFVERSLIAVGESDAALQTAIYLELDHIGLERRLDTQLSVFRFGTVPWSKQQKTRTGVYHSLAITEAILEQYERILRLTKEQMLTNKAGETYISVFPLRGLFADNLVQGKPWYRGFSAFMQDNRNEKVKFWSRELNEMVKETHIWSDEMRRQFVLLIQDGIRKRYGKVYDQAEKSGSEPNWDREYEKIRLTFSQCRTRTQLRKELMDFLARTRAGSSSQGMEMELSLIIFDEKQDWQEIRDLCLLALASYRKQEKDK